MLDARPARGWLPYVAPYALFLILVELERRLPADFVPWMLPAKAALPLAVFLAFALRGRFPELRGHRWRPGGLALDVGFGVAVAALWMAPYAAGLLAGPGPQAAFDPRMLGPGREAAALALRLLGFGLVTPFVEELFVRSFLVRAAELVSLRGLRLELDTQRDFRDLPMARYTAWSFWVSVLCFAGSHAVWELPVAFATGAAYNLWLYQRGHIAPCIVAHAASNCAIFAAVLAAAGQGGDLWYFL